MANIIITQLLAALFAFFHAVQNVPAIQAFSNCGSNGPMQRIFHSGNLWMRCFAISMCGFVIELDYGFFSGLLTAVSAAFIMWPVFNITINLRRSPKFVWHYLGEQSKIDKWFKREYGDKAGKMVVRVSAAVILIINILLLLIH